MLKGDVDASATAFSVDANNIKFDGKGHTITFAQDTAGSGILSSAKNGIVIKNVKINQKNKSVVSAYGIRLADCDYVSILNVKVDVYKNVGIYVKSASSHVNVRGCDISSNTHGIFAADSQYITVSRSTLTSTTTNSIRLSNSKHCNFLGCECSSANSGINLNSGSDNNTFAYCIVSTVIGDSISIKASNNNTFLRCNTSTIEENNGISLANSNWNAFTDCISIAENGFGIYTTDSRDNIFNGCTVNVIEDMPVMITNSTNKLSNMSVFSKRASAPHASKHILTVGDSITKGIGVNEGLGYGSYLNATLNAYSPTWYVSNVGIGGTTAAQGRVTFPQWLDIYDPNTVLIMYGQNDISAGRSEQDIIDDILWMAHEATNRSITPYILTTVPVSSNNYKRISLNDNLTTQAALAGISVIDTYDSVDLSPENGVRDGYEKNNSLDGIHPNSVGYTLMGNYVAKHILTSVYPNADFSSNVTSGKAPLNVAFTDKSTGSPTSWKWRFGDGTFSTTKNPIHTYFKAGKYTVSLTVKNASGSNKKTKKNYIDVTTLKVPVAAFSGFPTSGKVPLNVQFTDKSTGFPISWKWSFGDGTYSAAKNPSHTYSKAGKYTVSLTVKNEKGSNTKMISNYITAKSK
ncbi:MAG TPA: PKD domain-containing protein [Methanosarcina sp.]|nr:PKD domain-containing protein [Methanosarcina sp.]